MPQRAISAATLSRNNRPTNDIVVARADGAMFWDEQGHPYTDLSSQTMNLLFGQRHPNIYRAIFETLERYTFIDQDFGVRLYDSAIEALAPLVPLQLSVFNLRMNDGSSAVECAVKQARRRTGRPQVLTVDGIYLGQNVQTIHFRGWGKRPSDILIGGHEDVVFAPMPFPNYSIPFDDAPAENGEAIATMIREHHEQLACVLLDPVMVSCGVTSGRNMKQFLKAAASACRTHDVPLIFDECQTFGWVPDHTLARHYGIDVDMQVLAKGVGGGLPLSVCASRPEYDNLKFPEADYTNGGTPAAIAGLIATCKLLRSDEEQQRFNELSDLLSKRLYEFEQQDDRVRVRGVGLIWAIQILARETWDENCRLAKHFSREALRRGVYIRCHASCLTIKVPRVISPAKLDEAIDTIFRVIAHSFQKDHDIN